MKAAARRVTLFALALAACAPAADQKGADASPDASAAATAATLETLAAPSGAAIAARAAPAVPGGGAAPDSVRGVVERVGSDPTSRLVVRAADGVVCALRMTSPPSFEGLDVTLWGARDRTSATMLPGVACTVTVARYAVRGVDGIGAVDGILRESGGGYALELASGARPLLRDVPAALRTRVGARIFWAGPLDRAPAAYGVLVAER